MNILDLVTLRVVDVDDEDSREEAAWTCDHSLKESFIPYQGA